MATALIAASTAGGQLGCGHDEQAREWVEVAGLACVDGGGVGGEDGGPPRIVGVETVRVRLVQVAGCAHPSTFARRCWSAGAEPA